MCCNCRICWFTSVVSCCGMCCIWPCLNKNERDTIKELLDIYNGKSNKTLDEIVKMVDA